MPLPAMSDDGPLILQTAVAPSLCIFGDSSIACLRFALTGHENRLAPYSTEFWGTVGNRFRYLSMQDGAITPTDDFTAKRFAVVNRHGRTRLHPDDFDAILFMGCRTRVDALFMEYLHALHHPDLFLSSGVWIEIIRAHLRKQYAYLFAADFAARGRARVLYAPMSFQLAGHPHPHLAAFPDCVQGTVRDRNFFWSLIKETMAADGITLIAQPDRTVVEGCFTDPDYGTKAAARGDAVHKNGTYGATVLRKVRAALAETPVQAKV
jgi:hypothetical protein